MSNKCPGMDPAHWKFEDISEQKCINCGSTLEFWKDDVKRKCPKCGQTMFNPNIGNVCLAWCKKAEECLGNQDITEWKNKFLSENEPEATCTE